MCVVFPSPLVSLPYNSCYWFLLCVLISIHLLPCLLPPDVWHLQRFFGGLVYVLSSVKCLLTFLWSSSFDLLLSFSSLNVSLSLSISPSLCLDWGLCGGWRKVESRKTEDGCGEVKAGRGRTDMGNRVTSFQKEYCRDKGGSCMVSILGRTGKPLIKHAA